MRYSTPAKIFVWRLAITLVLVASAVAVEPSDPGLDGKWTVVGAEHGGKALDNLNGGVMTITSDRFEIKTATGNALKGRLELGLKTTPHTLSMQHDSGLHWEAIYQVEGETFRLNYIDVAIGEKTPSTFRTEEGSEATVVLMKRQKP